MNPSRERLSGRTRGVRPLALARLMAAIPSDDVVDLALGIPPGEPSAPVIDAAVAALRSGRHQYADASGVPALRQAIAASIESSRGVRLDPDTEITVTCGATEAVIAVLVAVTDPGDEVIVFDPFFENHTGAIQLVGAVPRFVSLTGPDWRLDPQLLRAAITPATRAVLYSTPHNPTGRVFDAEETTAIMDLCAEFDLTCITDEVYEDYVYDGGTHVSPLHPQRSRRHAVMLGSASKSLQVSGWRVGYCIADPELTDGVRRVHTRTTLGAATPLQFGVLAGMAEDPSGRFVLERPAQGDGPASLPQFQQRRDQLVAGLTELGFTVSAPDGGWFLLAGVERMGWSSDELVEKVAREAGVLLAPGTAFFRDQVEGAKWVRVTLVRDAVDTARALDRLKSFFSVQ